MGKMEIDSLVPILRAMVKTAMYYREIAATDDGYNECHYCDYQVDYFKPEGHEGDCPIPLIVAWLKEYDKQGMGDDD